MERRMIAKRTRDLVRLLGELKTLQERLLKLIEARIDAMKRADMSAMRELVDREEELTRRILERDGLRRQVADAVAEETGCPPRSGRDMTVSQIAGRVGEPARTHLLDAVADLRRIVLRVVRANRTAGAVARELINHVSWVFASVRPAGGKPVGYSGDGAVVGSAETRLFETVG